MEAIGDKGRNREGFLHTARKALLGYLGREAYLVALAPQTMCLASCAHSFDNMPSHVRVAYLAGCLARTSCLACSQCMRLAKRPPVCIAWHLAKQRVLRAKLVLVPDGIPSLLPSTRLRATSRKTFWLRGLACSLGCPSNGLHGLLD